jgi:hypothetical protein
VRDALPLGDRTFRLGDRGVVFVKPDRVALPQELHNAIDGVGGKTWILARRYRTDGGAAQKPKLVTHISSPFDEPLDLRISEWDRPQDP